MGRISRITLGRVRPEGARTFQKSKAQVLVRRVDAADGRAYTWNSVLLYYWRDYQRKDIVQYWQRMSPAQEMYLEDGTVVRDPSAYVANIQKNDHTKIIYIAEG